MASYRQEDTIFPYRLIIAIILSFLMVPSSTSASQVQVEQLANKIVSLLPHDASWQVVVADRNNGKEIISAGNTSGSLFPGSLIKLITAGAILERDTWGRQLKMSTEILHDGKNGNGILTGNLYIRGNGNCFLSTVDLQNAAMEIREKGVSMVMGDIVADTTRFDTRGLERTRRGSGYAPVSALGLDLHTASITVTPAGLGIPPVVVVEPPNDMVRFAVSSRTTSNRQNTIKVIRQDDTYYQVSGDISYGSAPLRWRFHVDDPVAYAVQSIRTIFSQNGIQIRGEVRKGKVESGITLLTISSPPLVQFINYMNLNSLNIVADNLLLVLGSLDDGLPGTLEKGVKTIYEHLRRHGITEKEVLISDGSGLLPGNQITSGAMTHYLTAAAKQSWFPAFHKSLPRSGTDGTLRMSSFKNEQFRVKSGSLENVAALAGYGVDKAGRAIAFTFIANTPGSLPPNARTAGDSIMQFLAGEVLQ